METEKAHEEIRNLLYDYSRAIDTKDWPLFMKIFTVDCTMVEPAWIVSGSQALADHMQVVHSPLDGSIHSITNIQVEVAGERAVARSYLDALLVRAGSDDGETLRVAGTYTDELIHDEFAWRIHHRSFVPLRREGNPGILGSRAI